MAERKCFIVRTDNKYWEEKLIEFDYYKGFALSQKQKSIKSFHENILKIDDKFKVLEISTKSTIDVGRQSSAFNLRYIENGDNKNCAIENVFQSSKVFENGGPYLDLRNVHPKEAKTDERLKKSGRLVYFKLDGREWPLIPETMFYDWIYINALYSNKYLAEKILDYNVFTDIEYNHKKSINCQARAAAIFVSLSQRGIINDIINSPDLFEKVYQYKDDKENNFQQLTFVPDLDIKK